MARNLGRSACAFCGERRAVRARVLPAWLDDCFPEHPPVAAERAIACRSCLRGWWAKAEEHARALVEPMVRGLPLVLDRHNQGAVALWAAKTMLALQAVRDRELFPPDLYRELARRLEPPTGLRVALATRPREGQWPCRFSGLGSSGTAREWDVERTFPGLSVDHYRAELAVGHLVIRAGGRFAPQGHAFDAGADAVEIWPARVPLRWPPARGAAPARTRLRRAA